MMLLDHVLNKKVPALLRRHLAGRTVSQAARDCGLSRSTLANIVNGYSLPQQDKTLEGLSIGFNISIIMIRVCVAADILDRLEGLSGRYFREKVKKELGWN